MSKKHFIPAFGLHRLTPYYDRLIGRLIREDEIKLALIAQARLKAGMRVLDLGCGTGTLAFMIRQAHPEVEVIGVDIDPEILALARQKAAAMGLAEAVQFEQSPATQLHFPPGTVDRVFSSLMLHHLTSDQKLAALAESFRVLRMGGELHVLDLAKPNTRYERLAAKILIRLEETADNIQDRLPGMLRQAGFQRVQEVQRFRTLVGAMATFQGIKKEITIVGQADLPLPPA